MSKFSKKDASRAPIALTDKQTRKQFNFQPSTPTMRCPCGGSYEADISSYAVLHSVPFCSHFENLDVVDFLKWARVNGAIPLNKLS